MSGRLRIRDARPSDEPALRALAEHGMEGAVRLALLQSPDFFAAERIRGEVRLGILSDDSDEVLGCGARVVRRAWWNGAWRRTGYYCTLRAGPAGRNVRAVRAAYGWAREIEREDPLPVITTAILSGNTRALRLLTSRRFGLPAYLDAGEVVTLTATAWSLRRFADGVPGCEVVTGDEVGEKTLRAFYADGRGCPPLFPELPDPLPSGLRLSDFIVLRRAGRLLAAAAVWDQRGFRQVRVQGYAAWLGWFRPLLNLAGASLGLPSMPAPGGEVALRYLAFRRICGDDPALLRCLLGAAARRLSVGEVLSFSVHFRDSLLASLGRLRAVRTSSRLFTISYAEDPEAAVFESPPYVEAAML